MKSILALFIAMSLLMPVMVFAQRQEPMIFEGSGYQDSYAPNLYVKILLFDGAEYRQQRWNLLAETICIPSFTPPWVVSIYHPIVTRKSTYISYSRDSSRYMVQMRRAVAVLTPETKDYKALSKKTVARERLLPASYAQEVIQAYMATMALAHWPKGPLSGLDGDWYHFTAHSDTEDMTMWGRAWQPEKETRTYKLTLLSEELMHFVEARSDSAASATLGRIHALAEELVQ